MQILGASAAFVDPRQQTDPTTNGASSDPSTGSAGSTALPNGLANEDTFLHLLVAQIQNQDPLNPTDSVQFVGQIVQFSQLEQLLGINSGIQNLVAKTDPTTAPAN